MKRIVIKFIFIMFSFLAFSFNVDAKASKYDETINDDKGIVLCSYENDYYKTDKKGGKYNEFNLGIKIFYYFKDKSIYVKWDMPNNSDYNVTEKKIGHKYIIKKELDKENFLCPARAYVDGDGSASEVCLGTKDYCLNKAGNIGTHFYGTSKMTSSFETDLKNYFDERNYFYGTTCKSFTVDKFMDKITTDIKKNYMRGNALPSFILNNKTYKSLWNGQSEKAVKYANECKTDIINDSSMTEAEKNKQLQNLSFTTKDFDKELDKVLDKLSKENEIDTEISKVGCDTLLGSIDDSGSPAYYINIAFSFIKYLAIIILIVFTILDYIKAVTASDDDSIKKANMHFVKRFILAIIIFILPTLIVIMLQWGNLISNPTICGIGGV